MTGQLRNIDTLPALPTPPPLPPSLSLSWAIRPFIPLLADTRYRPLARALITDIALSDRARAREGGGMRGVITRRKCTRDCKSRWINL